MCENNNERALTNKQVLFDMPTKEFVEKTREIMNHPLSQYINYERYFDSVDTDISHFISNKGKCYIKPSALEIQSAKDAGVKITDEWMKKQSEKKYLILDYCQVFGTNYVTVADLENMRIMKTPKESVVIEEP